MERLRKIPGVVVTGHVPDVRPFLKDALVSVAPLRMARGTQNKILESMAMGIPVVATSEAAKGVEVVSEGHILVGDDPASFAKQVISILKNEHARAKLCKGALKRIAQVHSWPRSMELLDAILNSAGKRLADPLQEPLSSEYTFYLR